LNDLTTKSSLTAPQRQLVELLQQLNFGRIENLRVSGGEPAFEPAPRIVQKLKMGGENGPRPEVANEDFRLKQQTIEMLEAIAELGNGTVSAIEIKHGLPFSLEIEHQVVDGRNRNA